MLRGGAVVARQAHNLKAIGSIPIPATNNYSASHSTGFFLTLNPLVSEGIYKFTKFSVSLLLPHKTTRNLSFSLFSGGQKGNYLSHCIICKSLILRKK